MDIPGRKRRKGAGGKVINPSSRPMKYDIHSNIQVVDCKSYVRDQDHLSHPLVTNAWSLILKDPVTDFVLDGIYREYIYHISEFDHYTRKTVRPPTDIFLPNASMKHNFVHNSIFLQGQIATKEIKGIIAKTNQEIVNFFGDVNVQEICNWMSLITLYFSAKSMQLEPFQKHLLCHSFIFSAVTRASDHSKIFKHLFTKLFAMSQNKRSFEREFLDYKKQITCVLVSRRQGKTFCAVKLLASGLICTSIRYAYFSNAHTLNEEIRKDVEGTIIEMIDIKEGLSPNYRSRFRDIIKHCPKGNIEPISITEKNSQELLSRLYFYSFRNVQVRKRK